MRTAIVMMVIGVFCMATSVAHAGTIIHQDTFETGPAGTPDVGSYALFGQSGQNVIEDDGSTTNNVLASTMTTSAYFILQTPSEASTSARVEYDLRVLSTGANLVGTNALIQQLILSVSPNNVSLGWGSDGVLRYSNGDPASSYVLVPGLSAWQFDTDYHVTWTVDALTDTVNLAISGLGSHTFAPPPDGNFLAYKSFAITGNTASQFTQHLDNFVITDLTSSATVPVPAAGWAGLALLGLLGIGRFSRRRRQTV